MGIQPIDLQTLYTQLDKVSKNVVQQQQGAALQSSMIMEKETLQNLQKSKAVEEAQKDDKMNAVKEKKDSDKKNSSSDKKSFSEKDDDDKKNFSIIKDPSLGKTIDISG